MRIIIIYNKDVDNVITKFGRQNEEFYDDKTIDKIASIFSDNGYDVRILDGNLDLFQNLREIISEKDKIPFVFNMAYGIQGESRYSHIPSILELLGLPYMGSGPLGHTLALDKIISKAMMRSHGIPTPEYWEFQSPDDIEQVIEFPVILKPSMEVGSFGLKQAHNRDDLKKLVKPLLEKFSQIIFAEKFIKGREFALPLIGNGDDLQSLPLVEMILGEKQDDVYTKEKKKEKPQLKAADVSGEIFEKMERNAKSLFRLLRLRDYSRVDIRMDDEGRFYFLEVNSMSGIQSTGVFIGAAEMAGYSYDEIIIKLLDVAVSKYFSENQKLKVRYESKYKKSRN